MAEMTALQALEELYGYSSDEWNEGTPRRKSLDKAHEVLRKALTPPTSEEVCEVLKEWFGKEFKFNEEENSFFSEVYCYVWNSRSGIVLSPNQSWNYKSLELIGRFYGNQK